MGMAEWLADHGWRVEVVTGQRVFRAGDCVAPRYMSQAILEGYRAGREV